MDSSIPLMADCFMVDWRSTISSDVCRGQMSSSVQAGEAVVAKQVDGQEWNERREGFRPGGRFLSVLMIVCLKMILGSDLMKGCKK